jgi:hypothetical protein
MANDHEHSRENIEIFSRARALPRTSPAAANSIHARMWASDESMRRRPRLVDGDERLSDFGDHLKERIAFGSTRTSS